MPKQVIRLEVYYGTYDENGNERLAPEMWPWEDMADSFGDHGGDCNCPGPHNSYYTEEVRVTALGGVLPMMTDAELIFEWHQENCADEACRRGDENCPVVLAAQEPGDDDDDDDLEEF